MIAAGHQVTALAPEDEETRAELASWGVDYVVVPVKRNGRNPLVDLALVAALRRTFMQLNPDLLFSYTIKPVIYGSIAASLAGVPRIVSMVTGLGHYFTGEATRRRERVLRRVIRGLYKLGLSKNHAVIFQNPDDLNTFVDLGLVERGKTHRVYGSGVNLDHYPTSPLPDGPAKVLFMGRLLTTKGVPELIDAIRRIKASHPDVEFRLLGSVDTNPAGMTQSVVDGWVAEGIVEHVDFTEDVRPHLAWCNVFILPSHREGTPRSVLEALATGRPVITTDAPGCRETVVHEKNGLLVPVNDPDAITQALLTLIESPELRQIYADESLALVRALYEVNKVNAEVMTAAGI